MADVIEIIASTKMQIAQIPLSQDSADRVKSYIFIFNRFPIFWAVRMRFPSALAKVIARGST